VLRHEIGAFNHDGLTRNAARVFGGQTMAGRLTVQPFSNAFVNPMFDLLTRGDENVSFAVPWRMPTSGPCIGRCSRRALTILRIFINER
jgi:hypothetical protein